jgi:hypothetical protein
LKIPCAAELVTESGRKRTHYRRSDNYARGSPRPHCTDPEREARQHQQEEDEAQAKAAHDLFPHVCLKISAERLSAPAGLRFSKARTDTTK